MLERHCPYHPARHHPTHHDCAPATRVQLADIAIHGTGAVLAPSKRWRRFLACTMLASASPARPSTVFLTAERMSEIMALYPGPLVT